MPCHRTRLMLLDYLNGELPEMQEAEVAAHIQGCPACAAEESLLRREMALFCAGVYVPPPHNLHSVVMGRLEQAGLRARTALGPAGPLRWDPLRLLRAGALAAASVCLAVAGLAFLWPAAGDALVSGAARLGSELTRHAGQRSQVLPGLVRAAGALLNLAGL